MDTVVTNFPEGFYSESFLALNFGNGNPELFPHLGANADVTDIQQNIQNFFDISKRVVLRDIFLKQYRSVDLTAKQQKNIDLLLKSETYTVTTGQQIHVGLGPMYVWNKIFSVFNTVNELSKQFPQNHYVPVFWMATEDHDFDEIKNVHFLGKDFTWNTNQTGAVGSFDLKTVQNIFKEVKENIQLDEQSQNRLAQIENVYKDSTDLSHATRELVQLVFGNTGLLVLDPNEKELKELSKTIWINDILHQGRNQNSSISTIDILKLQQSKISKQGIESQVYMRDINCFYLEDGIRERIESTPHGYKRVTSEIELSKEEMRELILMSPQKISPNVLLRPVYQQCILPNVVYIGGPAEVKYWMQMSPLFNLHQVPCPRLQLRLSSVFLPKSLLKKISKLDLQIDDFWLPWSVIESKIETNSAEKYTLDDEIGNLEQDFESIWKSLYQMQQKELKQIKNAHLGIVKELKKISREFKENPDSVSKLLKDIKIAEGIKRSFFNHQSQQERTLHWIEIFVLYGAIPIDMIEEFNGIIQFLQIHE